MEYPERPKQLCLQLTVTLGLDVSTNQPNFIVGGIVLQLCGLVMGLFLKILGMVEVISTNNYLLS